MTFRHVAHRLTGFAVECRNYRLACLGFAQTIGDGSCQQTGFGIGFGLAGIAELARGIEQLGVARSLGCAVLQVIEGALGQRFCDRR